MDRMGALYDELGVIGLWRDYAQRVTARALTQAAGARDDALGDEPRQPEEPIVREHDDGRPYRDGVAAQAIRPGPAVAVDEAQLSDRPGHGSSGAATAKELRVASLDDDALRSLGEAVLDELERRGVDG